MANKAKRLNHQDSHSFFPNINRIFRPKELNIIESLTVDANDTEIKNDIQHRYTNNKTITDFSPTNAAHNPITNSRNKNPLINAIILQKTCSSLNNKTSSGPDGSPNILLKNLDAKFIQTLTIVFNNIINNSYYSRSWKIAKIIPILKKDKDPSIASSYRPISLLSNVSKLFKTILNSALIKFCNKKHIIPPQQFGLRYKHSSTHAINKLLSDVYFVIKSSQHA